MLLMVECCGTVKEKCGKIIKFHVGAQEQGVSHGLCKKHELQIKKEYGFASESELVELAKLEATPDEQ